MPSPLRDNDPRQLGEYRIVARLGRGGMGTVFKGEDPAGRPVAVKVINDELAEEPDFHERFRREVTAARRVRRFCTAPVLDARLDGEPLYVVTEFVDGPSLAEAVERDGPLHGGGLDGLAVGIATALGAIHDAGIVHRDLKPSNVLLSPTGPRVIDFGIARALDAVDGPTRTGQVVGTPSYIAPEILRGEEVTPAADVFAWGCVVAYAGTGRAPFRDVTVPATMRRVLSEPPVLDGLDPALHDIVTAALDKDPRNRPTAKDLLARLTGGSEPRPSAPPASPPPPPPAPPTAPAPPLPPPSPPPTAPSLSERTRRDDVPAPTRVVEDRRSRRRLLVGAGAGVALVAVAVAAVLYVTRGSGDGVPEKTRAVLTDDFSDQQSGWGKAPFRPLPDFGYGFTEDGGYALEANGEAPSRLRLASIPKEKMPESVLASVTVKGSQGPPYGMFGLLCSEQYDNGASGYRFLVRRDGRGAVIRKVVKDRTVKELARTEDVPGIRTSGSNRVQIACEPDQGRIWLRLWVNGEPVADAEDADAPMLRGNVGLLVGQESGAASMRADFDDFELCEILY